MEQDASFDAERWKFGYLVDTIFTRGTWMHRLDISRATRHPMILTADHDGRLVDAVVLEGRSLRDTARSYGVSKSWVAELVRRYREGAEAALVAQSKRPRTNPRQMTLDLEDTVVVLRKELMDEGADAGAETIYWHLIDRYGSSPSVSAIPRALRRRGFISAQPRKRPKSSYARFEADLPNECWQDDMTHWQLADGSEALTRTPTDCSVNTCPRGPTSQRSLRATSIASREA